ncbi:MAG: hypothetical protein LQ352_000612 [Teloschistes flavicans]|nr:MAG: hypothetical protein LQ352_000612 [Teloschistes flavicans]
MPDMVPENIYSSQVPGKGKGLFTSETIEPGTCLSVYAAQLNHSCNPNCVFIFSGRSLSVRSIESIPAGGELTISYIDTTMSYRERQKTLKANYYFDCSCHYCSASLSCGEHDIPEPLGAKMTAQKISQLEIEGRRVSSLAEEAPLEKRSDLLKQAAALFQPHEDTWPLWRYPRSLVNYYQELISIDLGHWLSALGYALKAYLYIEPMQYRLSWHPVRIVRTFVLLKIIVEAGYQSNEGPDSHLYQGALQQFGSNWPLIIAALAGEVDAAVPQGFGMESSFAAEFRSFRENVSQHPKPGKEAWQKERVKLMDLATELVG